MPLKTGSMDTLLLSDILLQVLDITAYDSDKDLFVANFTKLCLNKSLLAAIHSLPERKQESLRKKIAEKSQEEQATIVKEYLDEQSLQATIQQISLEVLGEYLDTIMPVLSEEQKKRLQSYLSSLESTKK